MINQKLSHSLRIVLLSCFLLPVILNAGPSNAKDSLYKILQNAKTDNERVEAYVALSKYYLQYHVDSSNFYSLRAHRLLDELDDPMMVIEALFAMGQLQYESDSLLYGRDFLYESLDYFENCDCDSLKARVYFELGRLHLFQVNYYQAQQYFVNSLTYAEKIKSYNLLNDIYTLMGHLYWTIGNYGDAEQAFLKTLEYKDKNIDDYSMLRIYFNLGRAYAYNGKYKEARNQLNDALVIAVEYSFVQAIVVINVELGKLEFKLGHFEKALSYYKEAEKSVELIDNSQNLSKMYFKVYVAINIGKCYYSMGRFNDAIESLSETRQMALFDGQYLLLAEASKYLAMSYEQKKEYKVSLKYFKEHEHVSDSLLNVKNITEINRLETDYKHLKEINEKRLKRQALELKHHKTTKIFQFITLSGISLLLIVLLLFFIYRLKQREKSKTAELEREKLKAEKEKLQNELDFKNRELTTSVIYLLKKNNLMWNFSERLKKAILPLSPEAKKPLQDIVQEADANIGRDTWNDFETRFNQVHQSFTENLLKDFPELTPNELKLSAFLRLNMSTKEISTITYQSHNSITVARHRLRTKIGVEREENLVAFLSKY